MDDSDAHARRNVVLLSASVLAAWWLHLDLPGLLSLLHVAVLAEVATTRRVWLALAVLLAYLLFRYHFSPQRRRHWRAGEARVKLIRRAIFAAYIRHDLVRQRNRQNRASFARRGGSERERPAPIVGADVRELYVDPIDFNTASYEFAWFDDTPEEAENLNGLRAFDGIDVYQIPAAIAIPLFAATWFSRLLISRAGLEVSFPYYLAMAAFAICLAKSGI